MDLELTGFGSFEGVELLQKLPLFQRLSFDETTRLGGIIEYVDVPADTVVIEENALGNALYVVAKGECRVTRDADADGKHQSHEELARFGPGDLFGEMSLFDDVLTSARVSTVGECRLLKMPRQRFEALLAGDDKLAAKVYRSFCHTLSERLRRTSSMLAKSHSGMFSVR